MGSLFGSKPPKPLPAITPAPPVEQALFEPGSGDEDRKKLKRLSKGKTRLQIPLSKGAASGVGISYATPKKVG